MQESVTHAFSAWESYYVIVGSSAAALTGLQFVVIAILSDSKRQTSIEGLTAFGTPTVVHFAMALLVSAALSAPWPSIGMVAVLLAVIGAAGLAYTALVMRRARAQSAYQPVLEDWLWHVIFPLAAYAAVLGAGLAIVRHLVPAAFAVATATLLFLFIGIHNSWDTVTYLLAQELRDRSAAPSDIGGPPRPAPPPRPTNPPRGSGGGRRKGARR